jgi:hypothetical protein
MMIADIAPRLLKSEPYKAIHVQMIARGAINNTPANGTIKARIARMIERTANPFVRSEGSVSSIRASIGPSFDSE